MKIYTKTGDQGETSLVGGKRVKKSDVRIDLYGEVDELNSRLGLLMSSIVNEKELGHIYQLLHLIQHHLFNLGSNLACEAEVRVQYQLPQVSEEIIKKIENQIDELTTHLPELKNFILPGGHLTSSYAHICRTCCRKTERLLWDMHFHLKEELPSYGAEFLNRLSDYFFSLARYLNFYFKNKEVIWDKNLN